MKLDRHTFVKLLNDRSLNMSNLTLTKLRQVFDDMRVAEIVLLDKIELEKRCEDCIKEYRGEKWVPCELDDYCNKISIKEILKK